MTNRPQSAGWYASEPPTGRSREELLELLGEQTGFLATSARLFDEGDEAEAKRIAGAIRVLVHDTPMSHALLHQLGLVGPHNRRGLWFFDTPRMALPPGAVRIGGHAALCVMSMTAEDEQMVARYRPMFGAPPMPGAKEATLPFNEWWRGEVIVTAGGEVFTRKQVILTAANKEGGTHVDPKLPDSYREVTRGGGMGFRVEGTSISADVAGSLGDPDLDPVPATIRQIAHEVLRSVQQIHPELVKYDAPEAHG